MGKPGRFVRDIFFWTYVRGTLPYDVLCGLILAFVFFVPRSCFAPRPPQKAITAEEKMPPVSPRHESVPSTTNLPQQGK